MSALEVQEIKPPPGTHTVALGVIDWHARALAAEERVKVLSEERITTAAIKSGGVIVTVERPGRHGECINWLNRLGQDYMGQGFLTSHGRFVDRVEAGRIAKAAGQGEPRALCNGNLFSEDLWLEPFEEVRLAALQQKGVE